MLLQRLVIFMVAVFAGLSASAQTYPSKPIKIVAANPPGGLTDIVARIVAEGLREKLGQAVLVENQPGGSSSVGFGNVARSPADGYTLLLNTDTQTYMSAFHSNLTFDPVNDFEAISIILELPVTVAVANKLNVSTLQELINLAKKAPGTFNYASGGTGTVNHIAGVVFSKQTGVEFVHVPYQGSGPALADLTGGHVEMLFPTTSAIAPYHANNTVKVLAIAGTQRSPALPGVPTAAEAGLPGFAVSTWAGLSAPKGTPRNIIQKLHGALLEVIATPAYNEKLAKLGTVLGTTPEVAKKRIAAEAAEKTALVKSAGIKTR